MKTVIRPETEMKDSGLDWIRYIPENWNSMPLKKYFQFGKGLPITKADLTEIGEKVISYGQIHAKFNTGVSVDDRLIRFVTDNYKLTNSNSLCSKGDIILADTSEDKEGCGNAVYIDCNEKIFAGYHTIILKSTKDNKYLAYLIQSDSWRSQIRTRVHGVKLFSITQKVLNQCTIILPPLHEQQMIADYLDKTCSKIDEVVEEANASIDEYKKLKQSVIFEAVTKGIDNNVNMKESGIEWIGKIPFDWSIAKINHVAWTTSGATPLRSKETEYYDNAVIRWVKTLDLNNGHITDSSEKITETALKNSSCSIMPVKTVCVAMYGGAGTIGKSGILDVECATNQAICSIVSNEKVINPDYLHYAMMAVRKYWMKYAVGTRKDPNINQQIIAQMRIPVPPLSKQDIIVNHLYKMTDKCDSLIAEKESLINDLEAYKKSLIYEVVTGKRRVV